MLNLLPSPGVPTLCDKKVMLTKNCLFRLTITLTILKEGAGLNVSLYLATFLAETHAVTLRNAPFLILT